MAHIQNPRPSNRRSNSRLASKLSHNLIFGRDDCLEWKKSSSTLSSRLQNHEIQERPSHVYRHGFIHVHHNPSLKATVDTAQCEVHLPLTASGAQSKLKTTISVTTTEKKKDYSITRQESRRRQQILRISRQSTALLRRRPSTLHRH
jgi:hypothetical protein